jgi:4-amino-4-deoxy-L-arabinose transferase-like glycosyltransferase
MIQASPQSDRGAKLLLNRWIMLLLLLALGLRVGAAFYWHSQATADDHFFRLGDSHGYWVLAGHIARGEPYEYGSPNASVFRAPMMPILLSPFTRIADSSSAILSARIVAGSVLGTIAVALVACLAGRLAGPKAAIAAAALAGCYPAAIGMSIVILSEMLFVPLMLSYLLLWHSAWQTTQQARRIPLALLTGIVGGLAVLTRPSWLLFTLFVAILGLAGGSCRRTHLQIVVAIGLGMCLVMTPWWIRNYNITGKFVMTTLQVGPSLFDSLHQGATGGSDEGMQFMRQIEQQQIEEDLKSSSEALESTLEWRINQRAGRAAMSWTRENPAQVLQLAWAKFCRTWSFWPDGGEVGSAAIRLAISVSGLVVLLLAIWGSFLCWAKNRLMLAICWSPCLYFTLLHMVFVGSVRYREPAMMVLIAIAGCALVTLLSRPTPSLQESARVESALPDRPTG